MINILIVEDEIPARNSLVFDVSEILGNEAVINSAANGPEALEIAKSSRPDILLTDIRMPHMLGTELAEKILDEYPGCKIVFLSGYSDKNFFKSAIRLGVVDYIEKPIDTDDLKNALIKAVSAVNSLYTSANDTDSEVLRSLFKNKTVTPGTLKEPAEYVAVILLPCCEYHSHVTTLAKEAAEKSGLHILCHKKNTGSIEILLTDQQKDISPKLSSFFTRFFFSLEKNESFKCAVGSIENNISDIYKSYQNAVYTSDTAFFRPVNTPVYSDSVTHTTDESKAAFEQIANSIYQELTSGNLEKAKEFAELLYTKMSTTTQLLSATAKKIYYTLSESIIEYYKKFFPSSETENIVLYTKISSFDSHTLYELYESLMMLIDSVRSFVPSATDNITDLAIFYLEQNYSNPDLSISDIVRYCRANTSQLCSSFKATTGYTINQYLTQIRIDSAKKLLQGSQYSINDISDMCGFNYPKYFYRVFKKYTGMSPSDCRKKN